MSKARAPGKTRKWAAAHKSLTALLATAATVVGLATGVLTLRNQLFPASNDSATTGNVSTTTASLTPATAALLSDDVQLSRFTDLLGTPLSEKRLQNDEWLVSTWVSPDIAVSAFSNGDGQVIAFMLTSLGPTYTPLVQYLPGGVRLHDSVFTDVSVLPESVAGIYPANAAFSYEEFYRGAAATNYKSVVLAASYAANADDAAAVELLRLSHCLPAELSFGVYDKESRCAPGRMAPLRAGLHVTSMTVGEDAAFEALDKDGALFFPDAATGS